MQGVHGPPWTPSPTTSEIPNESAAKNKKKRVPKQQQHDTKWKGSTAPPWPPPPLRMRSWERGGALLTVPLPKMAAAAAETNFNTIFLYQNCHWVSSFFNNIVFVDVYLGLALLEHQFLIIVIQSNKREGGGENEGEHPDKTR